MKYLSRIITVFLIFWLRTSPRRAMIESWILALVILTGATGLPSPLNAYSLTNILFFTSALAGFWAAFRTRLDSSIRLPLILKREIGYGIAQSLIMTAGISLPLALFGRWQILTNNSLGNLGGLFLLAGSGLAYNAGRAFAWMLDFWTRLRKHSLMWSLTNAHLIVVVVGGVFASVLFTIFTFLYENTPEPYAGLPPSTLVLSRLMTTVLPTFSIFAVLILIMMAVLLPPSALFSFFFARQTTRRLQKVIDAAARFRSGDYAARVPVEGEDEVGQLQSHFNGMAEALERTLKALQEEQAQVKALLHSRQELVASVSHELRTPVATLRGYLDPLVDNPAQDPGLRSDIEVMQREVIRLQSLIDDLFTLSRAEVQNLPLDLQPIPLSPVIQERVAALAPLAWQSGRVEVICDISQNLPEVYADRGRLEQVLTNLLRNAIRYTPPGGIVAVMAERESDRVRLDVRDTGPGIAPGDLPHLWERFYRGAGTGANAQAEISGAGLGLAIVKELTEAMGGTVAVESTLGQGSCFTVWLRSAPIRDTFATVL